MSGIVQAQAQLPKMPTGPAPVNVPPAPPPVQKTAPSNRDPSHPHTRPNPQPTTQPPPNRGQPTANGQKNKKKPDPAPVDPAVMYESLRNRIAVLEEEETHEGEEERRFGASFTTSTLFSV